MTGGRPAIAALAACLLALVMSPVQVLGEPSSGAAPRPVKTLVDYRAELKLTDDQVARIQAVLREFGEQLGSGRKKLEQAEQAVAQAISRHEDLKVVEARLRAAEALRMEMRYLDVVTSRKVEGILTVAQLEAWRGMQVRLRKPQPKGS